MWKHCKILLLALILVSASACSQKKSNAEKLREKTMNILMQMDSLSYTDYYDTYIGLEAYQELAKKNDLKESYRKEILDLTKSSLDYFRRKEYFNLKNKATEFNISWNKIKYNNFLYKIKDQQGFNWLDGTLFFEHNGNVYEVRVYSIFDGKEYQFFGIKM